MEYVFELFIIAAVSLAGEILGALIPAPIPASIYGMTIMFILLFSGILKPERVEKTGGWLVVVMPVMFIPGGVGIIEAMGEVKRILLPAVAITIVTLVVTMAAAGRITEDMMRYRRKNND